MIIRIHSIFYLRDTKMLVAKIFLAFKAFTYRVYVGPYFAAFAAPSFGNPL